MISPKFKKGKRVKILSEYHGSKEHGTGIIEKIIHINNKIYYRVRCKCGVIYQPLDENDIELFTEDKWVQDSE